MCIRTKNTMTNWICNISSRIYAFSSTGHFNLIITQWFLPPSCMLLPKSCPPQEVVNVKMLSYRWPQMNASLILWNPFWIFHLKQRSRFLQANIFTFCASINVSKRKYHCLILLFFFSIIPFLTPFRSASTSHSFNLLLIFTSIHLPSSEYNWKVQRKTDP